MTYTVLGILRDLAIVGSFSLATVMSYDALNPTVPAIPTEIIYGSIHGGPKLEDDLVVKLGDCRHAFLKQDDGTFKSIGDLRKEEYSELLEKLKQ